MHRWAAILLCMVITALALVAIAVFAVSLSAFISSSALRTALFEMVVTHTEYGALITTRQVDTIDILYDLAGLPIRFDHIYVPAKLPMGFKNHEMTMGEERSVIIDYSDNAGNRIRLIQRLLSDNNTLLMTGDEAQYRSVSVGGYEGHEMVRSDGRTLVWSNHEYTFDLFCEGDISAKAMLEIAESLESVEK